jgi:signal transduction histidine kinase
VLFFLLLVAWLLRRDQVYKRTLREKIEQKSRQLHQEHRRMIQQSRLAQMGEMINMIAHQWRQPLSAIASTANSLQLKTSLENFDKAFFARRLDRIASYTQNLSATVDDFRNFFKPHKERVEITVEKICDDAAFIIEFSLNNNHIRLTKSYDCYKKICTYPSEIRQVVLNLLKNSEEAITQSRQAGGEIGIFTTIKDKDHICIAVEDNGGGIEPECMDKIFDPYFSTKDAKVGTGIGLYMSKMIITKHCGGTLEARNTDSGARFTVTLPIKV